MSWLVGGRRLHHRYERKADHFLAFTSIACSLICHRRLAGGFRAYPVAGSNTGERQFAGGRHRAAPPAGLSWGETMNDDDRTALPRRATWWCRVTGTAALAAGALTTLCLLFPTPESGVGSDPVVRYAALTALLATFSPSRLGWALVRPKSSGCGRSRLVLRGDGTVVQCHPVRGLTLEIFDRSVPSRALPTIRGRHSSGQVPRFNLKRPPRMGCSRVRLTRRDRGG